MLKYFKIVFVLIFVLLLILLPFSTVSATILGDANNDGIVDGLDYVIWLKNYNKSTTGSVNGDFNGNGFVDGLDYVIWLQNYNISATPTPSLTIFPATPSPTKSVTPTPTTVVPYDTVRSWVLAYKAAHPGNGGKDWDINAKTPSQIASDPGAQQLLSLCGPEQRPVYPLIAWEYGGFDHPWINPDSSALLYCVYIPVNPQTSHWSHNASTDRVTADVYVKFPVENPCKNQTGKDQVINCLGDPTNSEILVDTASFHDGHDVGLDLLNSSTELFLILPDGSKTQLLINI